MANNPYVNKVVYGNNTLIDLTDATATADKILQGYTAYGADGQKLTGTATGGGGSVTQDQDGFIVLPPDGGGSPSGGLVYETGTWSPSEDVARPTINFTNTHSSMPIYVYLSDSGNYYDTLNSNMNFMYCDYSSIANSPIYTSTTNLRYALVFYIYRGTSVTGASQSYNHITNPVDDQSEGSNGYAKYWVKPDSFRPYTNSDSRFWRAGRTYKWIAVWAPTT